MKYQYFFALLLATTFSGQTVRSQTLPIPQGKYAIGRRAYDWIDNSRFDQFSLGPAKHRELMVYIWYPAQTSAFQPSAPYFPYANEFDEDPAAQEAARDMFGSIWPRIVAGSIRSHAVANAVPVANRGKFPVVLFSHGYSDTTFSYTAQIENLVSYGYIVVAIEHTDAAGLVRFQDGRIRLFRDPPASPSIKDPRQAMIASAEVGTQIGAEDLRFVLDTLAEQKTSLAKLMDLKQVAAVGHSYGGTLTARACQIDSRIKACISEDGEVNPVGAFLEFPDHKQLKQSFMLIEIANHPTASELAHMGESQVQWNEFLTREYEQLETCGPGSYYVQLSGPALVHSSFSDGPVLNASADSTQASIALKNLLLTENLERSFLDKNLKGEAAPLLDATAKLPSGVQVKRVGRSD
jgi:predicted dienelactone hydrolase